MMTLLRKLLWELLRYLRILLSTVLSLFVFSWLLILILSHPMETLKPLIP